jgi:hypothetical protein
MDEQILEAVRRVIYRWVNTSVPLTEDVEPGDTTLHVTSTVRFKPGDEIALYDPDSQKGETYLYVDEILDNTTMTTTTPILASEDGGYGPSRNSMVIKTWCGNFIQGIYLGDPDVIPFYPAISILGTDKDSSWIALGLTKEDYKFEINVYVEQDNSEDSYRYLLRVTKAIEIGLKRNIFPLVGSYVTAATTADVAVSDLFIRVADTSEFYVDQIIILENRFRAEELRVKCVIDSTTLQIYTPVANIYLTTEDTKIIGITRFIYNSWPKSIKYGFKHKGSLLHASQIQWFAWEGEPQERGGHLDPHLS